MKIKLINIKSGDEIVFSSLNEKKYQNIRANFLENRNIIHKTPEHEIIVRPHTFQNYYLVGTKENV